MSEDKAAQAPAAAIISRQDLAALVAQAVTAAVREALRPGSDGKEPLPPSPDELAMRFAAALMASPGYADDTGPQRAAATAWHAVPHFYLGRETYSTQIAPMFFTSSEPPA